MKKWVAILVILPCLLQAQSKRKIRIETEKENAVIVNTTNINQTSNAPQTRKQEKENDRPAILEKSRG